MVSGGTERNPAPRTRLNRSRVIQAAIGLVDEDGMEALTMRALAEALGVKAMSLYNHVQNKDDLVDGMVDVIYREIALPGETDWKTAMRDRAISARQVLTRHPWAIALMESRTTPGPANLHHHDTVLAVLRDAGFSIQDATFAYSVIDSYIYGFALQQASLPFGTPTELAAMSEAIVALMPPDQYPRMRQAAVELPASGYHFAAQFETGLDLIIDGLERWHLSRRATPQPSS